MQFDADPRLAAAAGGAARYFADAAELDSESIANLQSATVAVCKEEVDQLPGESRRLEVKLSRSADRIEILVSRPGPSAAHRDAAIDATPPAGIDAIQHETSSGAAITRLTKYLGRSGAAH
jgi:hypothetical protein